MIDEEAPEVKLGDFHVFPYLRKENAVTSAYHAQEHFDERFEVRSFKGGHILTSDTRVIDARGFVVNRTSPLEFGVETFNKITRESTKVD